LEKPIDADITGLCDYLTASNIKNKVKHPLFLLLRFSNCVKLYYNSRKFQNWIGFKSLESCILCRLQTIFYSIQAQFSSGMRRTSPTGLSAVPLEDKDFIFVFQDSNDINPLYFTKSISEYIDPLKDDALHVTLKTSVIPEHFRPTTELQLERTYRAVYPYLLKLKSKIKFSIQPEVQQQSEVEANTSIQSKEAMSIKTECIGSPQTSPKTHPDPISLPKEMAIQAPAISSSHFQKERPPARTSAGVFTITKEPPSFKLHTTSGHQETEVIAGVEPLARPTPRMKSLEPIKSDMKKELMIEEPSISRHSDPMVEAMHPVPQPRMAAPTSLVEPVNMMQNLLMKQAEEQIQNKLFPHQFLPAPTGLQLPLPLDSNKLLQTLMMKQLEDHFKSSALHPLASVQHRFEQLKEVEALQRLVNQNIADFISNQATPENLLYSLLVMKNSCDNLKSSLMRP
jgi:hypothetical protein